MTIRSAVFSFFSMVEPPFVYNMVIAVAIVGGEINMLSPKPNRQFVPKNWEYLDEALQRRFNSNINHPQYSINVNDYAMSKEEIIKEAQKNGYKVTSNGDYLKFE
ncbi:MAG: hypothetical protein ACLTCC_03045 [Staphylococcus hominis]